MNLRLLAPFLLTLAAAAQPAPPPKPATVEGSVVNSVTGAALRKADVTLANGEITEEMVAMMQQFAKGARLPDAQVATRTFTAATDAEGKFRFENVPPGTYWLTVKKVGFEDVHYSAKGGRTDEGASFHLAAGQALTEVAVRMVPHGSISGRVLDEDGDPFPTANVTAQKYVYSGGHRRLMPADMAQTNNRGEFTLSKLPPGTYFLCADVQNMAFGERPAPPPADGSPETAYVGTYYPSALSAAEAQKVEVAAGGEVNGIAILLRKSRVVRMSGKLVDAAGAPIRAAQVMIMDVSRVGSMSMRMVNDPEGKFELTNLQPGAYTAMIMQMQGSSPKVTMLPLLVPDKNTENLKLGPLPEGTIQGGVTVEGDSKLPLENFTAMLTPSQAVVMPITAKADSAGAFALEHIVPASYDLALSHLPGETYVKSVVFNGREVAGQTLDCSSSASGTLRIVLGTDGGQVDASVMREDQHAAGATVLLLPADPARRTPDNIRTEWSDQSGHALVHNVPPGDYLAFAWEKIEDGQWFDPDFIKTVEGHAVKVRVTSKGSGKIELKLVK